MTTYIQAGDLVQFKPGALEADFTSYIKEHIPTVSYDRPYKLLSNPLGYYIQPKGEVGYRVYVGVHLLEKWEPVKTKVVTQDTTVCRYIILDRPISGLRLGDHYEVMGININGSYLVIRPSDKATFVVPKLKCVPAMHSGLKVVPCRLITPKYNEGEGPMARAKFTKHNPTPEESRLIKTQKATALQILRWATMQDGKAFIGGGAPRNWEFNKPAKDLDIFLKLPAGHDEAECRHSLRMMGVEGVFNTATQNPDCSLKTLSERQARRKTNSASNIIHVFEGTYQGEAVQFIYLANSVMRLPYMERYFDTSINMIEVHLNSEHTELVTSKSNRYTIGLDYNVIFYNSGRDNYSTNHAAKVASYFPGIPFVKASDLCKLRNEDDVQKYKMDMSEIITKDIDLNCSTDDEF